MRTLDDIRDYVQESYSAVMRSPRRGSKLDRLPLAVAEPGVLMERAVTLAGEPGLTRQQILEIFHPLGKERLDRGMTFMRGTGTVVESTELRPNRAGRAQRQLVFRGALIPPH